MRKWFKREYLWSLIYGMGVSWAFLCSISPKPTEVRLQVGEFEGINREFRQNHYDVNVEYQEEGWATVRIEPRDRYFHYFLWVVMAASLGTTHYRLGKKKKEDVDLALSEVASFGPDDEPDYEAFLSEDTNRRLVPRQVLEKDYRKWKEGHAGARR